MDNTVKNDKIGPTVIGAALAAEDRLDLTTLAATGGGYPFTVELEARDTDIYVRQGSSTVALHATAAQNALLQAGHVWVIRVQSGNDAFIAFERVAAPDGTLAATKVSEVA